MVKRSWILGGLMLGTLLMSSCLLDPKKDDGGGPPPPPPVSRQNLSQQWHVLNNIEFAYQKRRPDVYDELLDPQFTFFFSSGDVGGGLPDQWGRVDELNATTALFNSNQQTTPPEDPVCRSIRLDLKYDPDNINWVEQIPEEFPDETWYLATIYYEFTFEMEPDNTYIAQTGARAEFTIHNTGTDTDPVWKLVGFRDLGNN